MTIMEAFDALDNIPTHEKPWQFWMAVAEVFEQCALHSEANDAWNKAGDAAKVHHATGVVAVAHVTA